jgi:hypothetical protein
VDPVLALNPGLVFDSSPVDWERFVCGAQVPREDWPSRCPECVTNSSLCDLQQLNQPSIAAKIGRVQIIPRTVTNVLPKQGEFSIGSINNPPGFQITVTPSSFSLTPGASITLKISITHSAAPYDEFRAGSIIWTSNAGTVTRIPVVVAALPMKAPGQIVVSDRPGTLNYTVKAYGNTKLSTVAIGLQPARVTQRNVSDDPECSFDPKRPVGTTSIAVTVPPGQWTYLRFSIFDADLPAEAFGSDLDMFVFDKQGNFVAYSAGFTSDETVNIFMPNSTGYTVVIHGCFVEGDTTPFKLHVWMLTRPGPASSNVKSSPAANRPAVVGSGGDVLVSLTLSTRLLSPNKRWLGMIWYAGDSKPGSSELIPLDAATLIWLV